MTMASSSTMDHDDDDVNFHDAVDGWENDDGGSIAKGIYFTAWKVHHVLKVCAAHQVGKLLNVGFGGWGCAKGVNSVIT